MMEWARDSYLRLGHPFHVERHYWDPSWLRRYPGDHPPEAVRMVEDVRSGSVSCELRATDDVEALLDSLWYRCACAGLVALEPIDFVARWTGRQATRATHIPRRLRRWYRAGR
jgi:hypothetical protein